MRQQESESGVVTELAVVRLALKPEFHYFLRCMTLVHISSKPFLASLSGKISSACAARSTYSCAKARVCSMPSLATTSSRA
jgi:hypothetical protein